MFRLSSRGESIELYKIFALKDNENVFRKMKAFTNLNDQKLEVQ